MRIAWWMPLTAGVGVVVVASGFLFAAVYRVNPSKVVEHPYADSAHEDEQRAGMHAFAARGWRLDQAGDATGTVLSLVAGQGPAPAVAAIHLYRPDAPELDRDLRWPDPTQPLRIELPRPGAWQV